MKVKDAIAEVISQTKRKISYDEFGKSFGITRQRVQQILDRDLADEQLKKVEEFFNVNLTNVNQNLKIYDEKITLDYYSDLDFSCGNGLMPFSKTKEQMTIPANLIKGYRKERKYIIVNAKSDSMMPEIKPNDLLIIRMIDAEPIVDNHIYIFCYDERLYCKYLSWNIHQIIVRSANPDYETQYIKKENIELFQLYGEVVGHFRCYAR